MGDPDGVELGVGEGVTGALHGELCQPRRSLFGGVVMVPHPAGQRKGWTRVSSSQEEKGPCSLPTVKQSWET